MLSYGIEIFFLHLCPGIYVIHALIMCLNVLVVLICRFLL